jgi:hypothetical protein
MPNTIRTWFEGIGDVLSINGPEVIVETKNVTSDNRVFLDQHPVLVADQEILKKIKVGKKLGFAGIIRRIGNRTKLILNPERYSTNQSKLKDLYLNTAGISGAVVFKQFFGSDPEKRDMLTLGVGEPNATGTALYCSIWRDMAAHWNTLLTGCEAIVQVVGYMRSREMTGARAGDMMYELICDRDKSQIVRRSVLKTGFETFDDVSAQALMALEFDLPEQPSNPTDSNDGLPNQTDPASDIPF